MSATGEPATDSLVPTNLSALQSRKQNELDYAAA